VNPLYLGSRQRRIFSIYDAAVGGTRARAAVLCYPWGAEYVYAHRSMRQLALKLSMSGFHTLRFDFFGTGDSAGDLAQANLAGWKADTEVAVEAVLDIVGTKRVTLIGLRLGANLAVKVAAAHPEKCEALVLWDPIASGKEYLRSLLQTAETSGNSASDSLEVNGFELTPEMAEDLKQIDLQSDMTLSSCRSLLLETESGPEHRGSNLPGAELLRAPLPWLDSAMTTGELPVRVINRITEWLG
jgi:uncharacterized protein